MLRVREWLKIKYDSQPQFTPLTFFYGGEVRSVYRNKDFKGYVRDQTIFKDGNEYMIKYFEGDLIHVGVKIAAGAIVYDEVIEINDLIF